MDLISNATGRLLESLLDAAALRARVIAGNVANQNTPGYRRQVVRFEELLREAVESGHGEDRLGRIAPQVSEDMLTPARADGNNVSLELEMSAMRQNRLLYDMYTTLQASRSHLIQAAIEGR